eukprot:2946498-Rhodomonas_salina.1
MPSFGVVIRVCVSLLHRPPSPFPPPSSFLPSPSSLLTSSPHTSRCSSTVSRAGPAGSDPLSCYAMSSTDVGYGTMRMLLGCYAMAGIDAGYGGTRCAVLRKVSCSAMCSTEEGHGAT